MKYLIIGLGNPGPEYDNTRHNIGFHVLDVLAGSADVLFQADRYAQRAEVRHKGRSLICLKPQTFMNLSGKAVRYWMDAEKVSADRILVVTDDLALPFGRIRLRGSGGAGGHNGLTNIIETIGNEAFPRLRFGIGSEFARGKQVDHVLGRWDKAEETSLQEHVDRACAAVKDFALMGIGHAMSQFNAK